MSMSTLLRVTGVLYLMIMTFSVVRLLATAREANAWQRSLISTALWYNVLAIACLLSLTALVRVVPTVGGALDRDLRVAHWAHRLLQAGGHVDRVRRRCGRRTTPRYCRSRLLYRRARCPRTTDRPSFTPSRLQALLDFPATGAVIGYALGLVIASASVSPASRNVWLRRVRRPICLRHRAVLAEQRDRGSTWPDDAGHRRGRSSLTHRHADLRQPTAACGFSRRHRHDRVEHHRDGALRQRSDDSWDGRQRRRRHHGGARSGDTHCQ